MRCQYLSDLHLESQGFDNALPKGDVLIIAGDLCHARCLELAQTDRYSVEHIDAGCRTDYLSTTYYNSYQLRQNQH